jgi:hypothetical protein
MKKLVFVQNSRLQSDTIMLYEHFHDIALIALPMLETQCLMSDYWV